MFYTYVYFILFCMYVGILLFNCALQPLKYGMTAVNVVVTSPSTDVECVCMRTRHVTGAVSRRLQRLSF